MVRLVLRLFLVLGLLAVAALASFRVWAVAREVQSPLDAVGTGGLFVAVDGIQLHYREWGPKGGPPLLLVPGTLAWSETFRDIAAPLGEEGFHVLAVDMPPFGYSERPAGHEYSRKAQARRILGFADALKLGRFALGVHSYGGGAALEAAFSAPERINAMVLLDVALGLGQLSSGPPLAPLLRMTPVRNAIVAATFSNPWAIPIGLRDFVHDKTLVTPERAEIYQRPLTVRGTTSAIGHWLLTGLFADETGSLAANETNFRTFDRPTLVIWGNQDTVTPLEQGERIAALLPRAELVVIDNVNHIPQVERPGEVIRLIGNFLREASGKSDRLIIEGNLRGTLADSR